MLFKISHFYNWSFCFSVRFSLIIVFYNMYFMINWVSVFLLLISFLLAFFSCLIFNIYFRIFVLNFYLEKFILVLWMYLSRNLKKLFWRYVSILLSSVFSFRNLVYCIFSLITPVNFSIFFSYTPYISWYFFLSHIFQYCFK